MVDESPPSSAPLSQRGAPVSQGTAPVSQGTMPVSQRTGPISQNAPITRATSGSMPVVPVAQVVSASIAVTPKPQPKEAKLGRLLHESRPPPRALAVFIVSVAVLALWLGLSVSFLLMSGRDGLVSIVIVSLVLFMPASLLAQWAYAKGMLYVAIHENGIAFRDAQDAIKLGWDDIAGIFERAWVQKTDFGPEKRGSFTFVGKDKRIVIDSELREWLELGREAREQAEAALFNAYERAADEKRALPFGKLILHPEYIETPDGQFPWKEITFLRFERNGLEAHWLVQRGGYSCVSKVPTHEVANGRLLVGVLAKIGKLDGIEIAVRAELDAMLDDAKQD